MQGETDNLCTQTMVKGLVGNPTDVRECQANFAHYMIEFLERCDANIASKCYGGDL